MALVRRNTRKVPSCLMRISSLLSFSFNSVYLEMNTASNSVGKVSFYSNHILPRLIDWVMSDKHLPPLRTALLSVAKGQVAEIGFGAGANLPFYPASVEKLFGIEPSEKLLERAKKRH